MAILKVKKKGRKKRTEKGPNINNASTGVWVLKGKGLTNLGLSMCTAVRLTIILLVNWILSSESLTLSWSL